MKRRFINCKVCQKKIVAKGYDQKYCKDCKPKKRKIFNCLECGKKLKGRELKYCSKCVPKVRKKLNSDTNNRLEKERLRVFKILPDEKQLELIRKKAEQINEELKKKEVKNGTSKTNSS